MTGKPHTGDPASPAGRRAHTMPGQRAVNLLVRAMLRTPGLAPIVGGRLVTLYPVGRKSRRRYCIPVVYVAEGDHLLIGTSFGWGRNLRTGEPVDQAQRQAQAGRRPHLHDGARSRLGVRAHGTRQPDVREVQQHPPQRGRRARSPRPPPRMGWRCTSNQADTTMTGLASAGCLDRTGPSMCATSRLREEAAADPYSAIWSGGYPGSVSFSVISQIPESCA
jgi:hypothetical protein